MMRSLIFVLLLAGCSAPLCSAFHRGDKVKVKGTELVAEVIYHDCTAFKCRYSIRPLSWFGGHSRELMVVNQEVLEAVK